MVLIRTGTARYWGENGSDHAKIGQHDTAGIGLAAARWLVEQKGALAIGADTSGLEYVPPKPADSQAVGGSFNPVHVYLLVNQGIHIMEFHNLERLAADRVYEFAYVATTNAIRGSVAGTALAPSRCAERGGTPAAAAALGAAAAAAAGPLRARRPPRGAALLQAAPPFGRAVRRRPTSSPRPGGRRWSGTTAAARPALRPLATENSTSLHAARGVSIARSTRTSPRWLPIGRSWRTSQGRTSPTSIPPTTAASASCSVVCQRRDT